jgi:hypothetical protein
MGSLALGAQWGKLDADLRTFVVLGTPSNQPVHDYYPFALDDGGRLTPIAAELVDRLVVLSHVVASMAWVMRTLVHCALIVMSAFNILFDDLFISPFDVLGGCAAVRIPTTSL